MSAPGGPASTAAGPTRSSSTVIVAIGLAVLVVGASELVADVRRALEGDATAPVLEPTLPTVAEMLDLARLHGATSLRLAIGTIRGSARTVVAFVVFVGSFHAFTIGRERIGEWLDRSVPLPREAVARLTAAFYETGRGLFVGVGLTAAAQGVVATIVYLALGIPRAPVFGFVTAVAALVPGVGTGFVWVPMAIVLAASGHPVRALILGGCGIGLISVIDNVLRPYLARYGKLRLSAFLLFVTMMGGVFALGPAGLFVGPLAVRMAIEAIDLARAARDRRVTCVRIRTGRQRPLRPPSGGERSTRR